MDFFIPFWTILFLLISIFFVVARYLSLYELLFDTKIRKIDRDWEYTPNVSIMMSCFNEGRSVYECIQSILQSNYPLEKIEIVAFDDCSKDDSFEWMQKIAAEYPKNVIIHKNQVNLGKCLTMVEISKIVSGDVLIGTDSDTIFDTNAIRELVSCFANPKIGAVGGQVRVKNVNDSILTQYQALYYVRVYYLYKALENLFVTARCLAGPIVAFRREAYLPLMPFILQRTFLGEPITYGEDTFITSHLIFAEPPHKKWIVYTNIDAKCWTGTPATWSTYLNQQLRWRRGTIVNGLRVFYNLRHSINVGGLAATLLSTLPLLVVFAMIVMAIYLFAVGNFLQTMALYILIAFLSSAVSCAIYNVTLGKSDPMGKIKNPMLVGLAQAVWMPVSMFFLTVVAMFTLDDGGWVTRQNSGNIE